MGKPRKVHKKFNYSKNRRKEWKKTKKLPKIGCKQMKDAWDERRTVEHNLRDMGLSADPNQTFPVPTPAERFIRDIDMEDKPWKKKQHPEPKKLRVAQALEREANAPQPKRFRLSEPDTRYCIYMMERYGEDYKAMAKDPKNYYQDTPKQIRSKIRTFMSIPEQYNAYRNGEKRTAMETS
ncbi:Nucleolar protein 16 [Lamellibrachia satsuma]|nr:Nucleolar protein 16 [Lamellibrachia satsuma]